MALLRFEKRLLVFEKAAVVAARAQDAVGIGGVDLRDLEGDCFEEVSIMADSDGGEGCAFQNAFEPLDAFEVEMVRRLVQQEHVGCDGEGLCDGEAFRQPPESVAAGAAKFLNPARPRVSRIFLSRSAAGTWAARTASSITDQTVSPAAKSEICET